MNAYMLKNKVSVLLFLSFNLQLSLEASKALSCDVLKLEGPEKIQGALLQKLCPTIPFPLKDKPIFIVQDC